VNPRYRETFRRNRRLFLLPVVLGAVIGLTFGLGSPKLYRSDATLSFKSFDTSAAQFGAQPPAAQNQAMLNELLATHGFPEAVAKRSPLEDYLKNHDSTSWTPTALLKRFLKGKPTLDERIAEAFSSKRVTSMPSTDLLEVSFAAPDPVLAQQTLKVLISEFLRQRKRLQGSALSTAIAQFTKARTELAQAKTDLGTYVNQHPGSTTADDPELAALTHAQLQAVRGVRDAANTMNTAMNAVNGGTGLPTQASVFDEPRLPVGPTTGKKRVVELGFAGAFVGALISFLAIMFVSRPGASGAAPGPQPVGLPGPSPVDADHEAPEQERAAAQGGETKNPFLTRRE
jgi:hypothetical protein